MLVQSVSLLCKPTLQVCPRKLIMGPEWLSCFVIRLQTALSVQCLGYGTDVRRVAFQFKLKPLTPNDHYSGRTAPLTSKVSFYIFIQQIKELNILNMIYTLRFLLFKMQFVS